MTAARIRARVEAKVIVRSNIYGQMLVDSYVLRRVSFAFSLRYTYKTGVFAGPMVHISPLVHGQYVALLVSHWLMIRIKDHVSRCNEKWKMQVVDQLVKRTSE